MKLPPQQMIKQGSALSARSYVLGARRRLCTGLPSSSFILMCSKECDLGTWCMRCIEESSTSALGDTLGG